ncbi:hypothetical protein NEOLEDRAFT_949746 [Neolentinus lepideus HHB14362 ss-1]|uniref:Uncharacterized protein n=1 Tax=Neolentinus lepideus HHB14362 ss-1 TaxID=1314782 RepID=A0A165UDT9_9AGAM|nr:hypothetical protein NEOLEDRAFT_949746 [Neolentinus lepideus HHB14362 ss-1]
MKLLMCRRGPRRCRLQHHYVRRVCRPLIPVICQFFSRGGDRWRETLRTKYGYINLLVDNCGIFLRDADLPIVFRPGETKCGGKQLLSANFDTPHFYFYDKGYVEEIKNAESLGYQ